MEKNYAITFKNVRYIWIKGEDGTGPIIYPTDFDFEKKVRKTHLFTISFAYVAKDGDLNRDHRKIGTVSEFTNVKEIV